MPNALLIYADDGGFALAGWLSVFFNTESLVEPFGWCDYIRSTKEDRFGHIIDDADRVCLHHCVTMSV
jgi:hypothetical protein